VAFRVHALLVTDVVALLHRVPRCLAGAAARERAARETDAGANARAGIAAHQPAGRSTDCGADHGALHRRVVRGLGGGGTAD